MKIRNRVKKLAQQIRTDYRTRRPILIGVLKGAVVFLSDLIREIDIPLEIDFLSVASYYGAAQSSGAVKVIDDLTANIKNRDVLIVDDIVDTGLTLDYLMRMLRNRGPKSLRTCVLLDKKASRKVSVPLSYVGFRIPNRFIVGYGLDFKNRYRNMRFIGALDGRKR